MPPAPKMSMEEKIKEAKRKAEEMKAKMLAKKAAKEEAAASGQVSKPVVHDTSNDNFIPGEHNVILIDWDDTLFPTSAWKGRIGDGVEHPLRASKVEALSEAISGFITELQKFGEVKIVTHACKSWFDKSAHVLQPATRALLENLPARYRDSYGQKYMHSKPKGEKYQTDIGSQVDNYAEWYKTDMFFHFISEKKQPRKWDETHLPEKVALPQQVLVIGDGSAELRGFHELGKQRDLYASQPGHAAVANVGLKGVFLKDGPSYDELLLQLRWATANVQSRLLPAGDARTMMFDLTG
jgi:hypothetical protein